MSLDKITDLAIENEQLKEQNRELREYIKKILPPLRDLQKLCGRAIEELNRREKYSLGQWHKYPDTTPPKDGEYYVSYISTEDRERNVALLEYYVDEDKFYFLGNKLYGFEFTAWAFKFEPFEE